MALNSNTKMVKQVDNMVLKGIVTFLKSQKTNKWTGTMTDLSSNVRKNLSKDELSMMPKSPSALRVVVNRIVNRIRNNRIGVKFTRTAAARYVIFSL